MFLKLESEGNLIGEKGQRMRIGITISRHSSTTVSKTTASISCHKIRFDAVMLLESSMTLLLSLESIYDEIAKRCNCYCNFVKIQTHIFSKPTGLNASVKVFNLNFFVKIEFFCESHLLYVQAIISSLLRLFD